MPMLRDAWYSGRADSAGLAAAVAKARICLRALEGSRVWQELEACPTERIVVPTRPEAFVHEGWPIYAGPDLVYCPDDQRVVILDWKTGDDSDAELQIPLYALYCRSVLGLRFREEAWFGRVVNLATGDDTTREITRYDLMLAAERVRHSVRGDAGAARRSRSQRAAVHRASSSPSSSPSGAAGLPVLPVLRASASRNCRIQIAETIESVPIAPASRRYRRI
jgi:hypothetical protein